MLFRHWWIILLITALGFGVVSAQTEFAPGDRVIYMANSSPVYPSATSTQVDAGEISRGTVSQILAIDEAAQRIYLSDSAFGWVDMMVNGEPSLAPYDPAMLTQISNEAAATISTNSADVNAHAAQAMVAVQEKRYQDAIDLLTDALEKIPNNGYLFYQRAGVYLKMNAWTEAMYDAQQAIDNGYEIANVHNRYAIGFEGLDYYDIAISEIQLGIAIEPEWGLLYSNLAGQHLRQGENERAIELLTEALDLDPLLLIAYTNRSKGYKELGDFQAALDDLNMAIETAPFVSEGYVNRAVFYSETLRDYALAHEDYDRAIELEPNEDYAYTQRAVTYIFQGDDQRAIDDLKRAIDLDPTYSHTHFTLASLYAKLGHYDESLQQYTIVIELNGSQAYGSLLYRPQLYIALGDYASALDDLNTYIDGNPSVYFAATAFMERATTYAYQGQFVNARDDLLTAQALQPEFTAYFYQYGSGYRVTNGRSQRIVELQDALLNDPKDSTAQRELGLVALEFGLWQIAYDSLNQYRELTQNQETDFANFLAVLESLGAF